MFADNGKWLMLWMLCLALGRPLHGEDTWIGHKFMPTIGCAPTINGHGAPRGTVHTPLIPRKVNGNQLWVGRAWVKKSEVVPLEEAEAYYNRVLEANPKSVLALSHRGYTKQLLGNQEGAIQDWNQAIKVDPDFSHPYASLANYLLTTGELVAASRNANEAVKLDPLDPTYRSIRAEIRVQLQEWEGAFADVSEALRLDPQCAGAFHTRGMIWQLKHQNWQKALADYDQAIRLNPENYAAHSNRALIRAASPDERVRNGKQALADAMRVCQATDWRIPKEVRTLAAAHAELGQFEEARKWQQKAIQLAGTHSE